MPFFINLVAGTSAQQSSISVTGSMVHVITDNEIQSFKVGDAALKKAVGATFGKDPNDAYLRSPTPWGDLYITYGWLQVQCTVVPVSAVITGLTSEPTVVSSQELRNTSNHSATFSASIQQTVQDTVASGWSSAKSVSFSENIELSATILGIGVKGSTGFALTSSFGESGEQTTSHTVGSASAIQVVLDPGQSALANLTCSKGALTARITYEAFLSGDTAVHYDKTYKDHYFWALDINGVMATAKIINSILIVQDLEVGFYSNGNTTLSNIDGSNIAFAAVVPGAPRWAH